MSRLLIALLAVVTLAALPIKRPLVEDWADGLAAASSDSVVLARRVFEGAELEFWGTAVSPDGRFVSQWHEGSLAVLDLVTGVQRTVPSTEGYVGISAFSPDGNRIAYTTGRAQTYQIRVVDIDGANDRMLWKGILEDGPGRDSVDVDGWPEVYGWTSDGSAVLAAVWRSPSFAQIALFPVDGSPRKVLHRPSGGGLSFAALSPDGRHLAFTEVVEMRTADRPRSDVDVFVVSVQGEGRPVAVAPSPVHDELVGWTEDGRLLLASEREFTQGVWSVDVRNGKPVGEPTLVKGDLWGMRPLGMAGTTVFYFVATQHRQVHTVGLSLEGRRLLGSLVLVEPDMRPSEWPTWSPDGRRIAYKVVEAFRGSTEYELGIVRTATGQSAQEIDLENVASTSRNLTWAHGEELYFRGKLIAEDGARGFTALDLETGKARTLYKFEDVPGCSRMAEFDPKSQRAFCARRDADRGVTELVEMALMSGDTRIVWRLSEERGESHRFQYLSLSPDQSRFAFWVYSRSSEAPGQLKWTLNVLPAEGGESRPLMSFQRREDAEGSYSDCSGSDKALWTPSGEHLLVAIPEVIDEGETAGPEACPLYLVPVSGGDPVKIGALPEHGQWALSPDGTRLAVVAGEPRGEIWVLEER